jgi:hypothetical protein
MFCSLSQGEGGNYIKVPATPLSHPVNFHVVLSQPSRVGKKLYEKRCSQEKTQFLSFSGKENHNSTET